MSGLRSLIGRASRRLRPEPKQVPPDRLRNDFARELSGRGVEIGALHRPFPLSAGTDVTYVDRYSVEDLGVPYPDVDTGEVVRPALLANAMELAPLPDGSQDFVVASHVLEHLDNPVKALFAWRRVLRPGGRLLLVVPDARYTFDRGRPLTTLEHLLWDAAHDGADEKRESDLRHVAECEQKHHPTWTEAEALARAREVLDESYDSHFHVWTHDLLRSHLEELIERHGLRFTLLRSASDDTVEMLFLLEAVA